MTLTGMKKFMAALETAGIKTWDAMTDTGPTHYYNNDVEFNLLDEGEEMLYTFCSSITNIDPFGENCIVVKGSHLSDIHEVRIGGSLAEIKAFIEAYGMSLTEEQTKILININAKNYSLKPMTGDYLVFEKLTNEQLAQLTPEQLAEYNEALAKYEKKKAIRMPVQVTV